MSTTAMGGSTPGVVVGAGPEQRAALERLFRHSLAQGKIHPLYSPIMCYRGVKFDLSAHAVDVSPVHLPQHTGQPTGVVLDPTEVQRRVRDLPALPQALQQALIALRQEDARTDYCAALIEHDPALCARMLRMANSAFYGMPGRVGSVHDAFQLLGLRTVTNLLTTVAVTGNLRDHSCEGFDMPGFWRHALGTALVARDIALLRGLDADHAFMAGLLRNVGRLALLAHFPDALRAAIALARSADCPLEHAEQTLFGVEQSAVGRIVANHWQFPSEIAEAIGTSCAPPDHSGGVAQLVDAIHLADAMAHAMNLAGDADASVPPLSLASWEHILLSLDECQSLFAAVEAGVREISETLNL